MPADQPDGMKIKFWGTRGSIPTPGSGTVRYGGNTACVEVCWVENGRIIFDAGTGIRLLGESLSAGGSPPERIDILFSHLHWDHIQGLPFFIPMYVPGTEIHLWGSSGKGVTLDLMLDHQLHTAFFPIGRSSLAANLIFHLIQEGEFDLSGAHIKICRVNHPGGAYAFRLEAANRSVVYSTDREPDDPAAVNSDLYEPALIEIAKGADLLIHDAQYTSEEYGRYRRGWGHSTAPDAVRLARAAGIRKLVLFHHDPSHTDEQLSEMEVRQRSENPDMDIAYAVEGTTVGI